MKNIINYMPSIPFSIYVNLRLLPIRIAWRLPILISRKSKVKIGPNAKLTLKIVRLGIVKIGFGENELFDFSNERTVFFIDGIIIFDGSAFIGPGSQVWVKGKLKIGDKFSLTCRSMIAAAFHIDIGRNVLIAWGGNNYGS